MAAKKTFNSRIEKLEARNQRVEANKAWETSWLRRLSIMLFTYYNRGLLSAFRNSYQSLAQRFSTGDWLFLIYPKRSEAKTALARSLR